ncbi:hypothetical protein FACS1894172_12430 [Spirochaetia bacterium]|nr:hypothetical protein FACS1894164_16450 [Spirochaetia bacterium]GHU33599.1 hypothetical protein FACS1894172_12430 [Spirochaetia bacterium]
MFEKTVSAALNKFEAGAVFLAAVSGGADSTAMVTALYAIQKNFHVLHVEHGIRPEPERHGDVEFVTELCRNYGVPYRIVRIRPGAIEQIARRRSIGIEASARLLRHRIWNQEAHRIGAERVLVAHTQDDLLETVLMRFLRGSGPAGLAALPQDTGTILRPLLTLNRADVLAYLSEKKCSYRTDSTNDDIRFFRNRIRHCLIPCLNEYFPDWKKPVRDLAETQRFVTDFLQIQSHDSIVWDEDSGFLTTDAESFFARSPIIREEALFQAADLIMSRSNASCEQPDPARHKEKMPRRETLRSYNRNSKSMDAGPIQIVRNKSRIEIRSAEQIPEQAFALLIKNPGIYMVHGISVWCGPVEKNAESGFCAELPLVFRQESQCIIAAEDQLGTAAVIYYGNTVKMVPARSSGTFYFHISKGEKNG